MPKLRAPLGASGGHAQAAGTPGGVGGPRPSCRPFSPLRGPAPACPLSGRAVPVAQARAADSVLVQVALEHMFKKPSVGVTVTSV